MYTYLEDSNEEAVNLLDDSLLQDRSLDDDHGGLSENKV